jgi:predicted O-methyltransferase YrrM
LKTRIVRPFAQALTAPSPGIKSPIGGERGEAIDFPPLDFDAGGPISAACARSSRSGANVHLKLDTRLEQTLLELGTMSKDYVSENLEVPDLASHFPNMVAGDKRSATWPYFRKEIDHTWYVDRRDPQIGFINRDEAALLYANARLFSGKRGLEIGAWRGWSSCHLLAARLVSLHIVEPRLADEEWNREFAATVQSAGGKDRAIFVPGFSPAEVIRLGESGWRWSFAFIDGDHDGDAPKTDALAAARFLEPTAMILFHDLASPHVASALHALKAQGWRTVVYQTAQIMGVAWRGDISPVRHKPDASQVWRLPEHLAGLQAAS